MEISIYGIHHIVSRYLSLRRYVYVVSDYMVFFCSFLCCQCAEYAQESPAESVSDASLTPYQIVAQKVETETKLACGDPCKPLELVVDIHHFDQAADEDDELKSTEILDLENRRRDLDGTMVTQDNYVESTSTELTSNPVPTKDPVANKRNGDYPIVHKRTQEPQPVGVEFTI